MKLGDCLRVAATCVGLDLLPVEAASILWRAVAPGNWTVSGNWDLNRVPEAGDDVVIPIGTAACTYSSGANTVQSLTVGGTIEVTGGTLTVAGASAVAGTLTVAGGTWTANGPATLDGTLNLTGGTLTGGGTLTVNGTMVWSGGAKLQDAGLATIAATGTVNITGTAELDDASLTNAGNLNWTSGDVTLRDNAQITNQAGRVFRVQSNGSNIRSEGTGTRAIHNAGTLRRSGNGGTTAILAPFNNDPAATVDVQAGALYFGGGGSSGGTFTAAAGTQNVLASTGTMTLQNGTQFTGVGTHRIASWNGNPTVTLANGATVTVPVGATLQFEAGTLNGAGTLDVSGTFGWQGGTLGGGGGTTRFRTGTTVTISSSCALDQWTLLLEGTTTWTAGTITLRNDAAITNEANATFYANASNSSVQTEGGGAMAFRNNGTVIRAAGVLGARFMVPFVSGTGSLVDVRADVLRLDSGGSGGGEFRAAGGTSMYFERPTPFTFTADARFTGAGIQGIHTWGTPGALSIDAGVTVTVDSGSTFHVYDGTLSGAGTLDVKGEFMWEGGALSGSGATIIDATSGTWTLSGSAKTLDGRSVTNRRTATWSAGHVTLKNNAVITNEVGAVFYANASGSNIQTEGAGAMEFRNNGTVIRSSAASIPRFWIPFVNGASALVDVQQTGLRLDGGGSGGGEFRAAAGTTMYFERSAANPFTFTADGRFTGAGTQGVWTWADAGAISIAAGVTVTVEPEATFHLTSAGIVTGAGTLEVKGVLNWEDGTMSGTGATIIAAATGSCALFSGSGKTLDGRLLTNRGTTVWTGGLVTLKNSAVINNEAGATFDARAETNMSAFGAGAMAFNNRGTLTRTSSPGSTVLNLPVNNLDAGTITVQSGQLVLAGGGNLGGTLTAAANTILSYSFTPEFVFTRNTLLTGAGTHQTSYWNAAATLSVADGVTVTVDTNSTFYQQYGLITGPGTFDVLGTLRWESSGLLSVSMGGSGTTRIAPGATANFTSVNKTVETRTILNQGTLNLPNGLTLTMKSSTFRLDGGTVAGGGWLYLDGGTLSGTGTLTAAVTNAGGHVRPGTSAGQLTITGSYAQTNSGILDIEIGGTNPGSGHDKLVVVGQLNLDTSPGSVAFSLIGGFSPAGADTFTVLTAGSRSGQFSAYSGTELADGRVLLPTLGATDLVVSVYTPQPDLLIKQTAEADAAYAIDNTYQTTPAGDQIETLVVAPNDAASFAAKLQNDNPDARTFVLKAAESADTGWTVTYRDAAATDITADVLGAGWTSPSLAAGNSTTVSIAMIPDDTVTRGTAKTATLNVHLAVADATVRDSVRAVARVTGVEWAAAVSGNWTDGSKWTTGSVPAATDDVFIRRDGTYTVTLNADATVASLTLGANDGTQTLLGNSRTLNLNGPGTVAAKGVLVLRDGALGGTGTLTNRGSMTLESTSTGADLTLANAGNGNLKLWGPCPISGPFSMAASSSLLIEQGTENTYGTVTFANGFVNNGLIELVGYRDGWGNPSGVTVVVTNGTLENAVGATLRSLPGHGSHRTLAATLNNLGTLDLATYGLTLNRASAAHANGGTIVVTGGDLTVTQSGTDPTFTNTGTIAIGADKKVLVTGGGVHPWHRHEWRHASTRVSHHRFRHHRQPPPAGHEELA